MKDLLVFLDGKKVIIAGIITTTAALFVVKHIIDADVAAYINAIVTLVFGSASVATKKLQDNGSI